MSFGFKRREASMAIQKKQSTKTQPQKRSIKKSSFQGSSSTSKKGNSKTIKKKTRSKRPLGRLVLWLIPLFIVGALGGFWYYKDQVRQGTLKAGLDFLTTQENNDLAGINSRVDERNRQDALTRFNNVNEGIGSVWTLFKDSVIMGDSRVYGFKSYGFLPENQVLAEAGYTINNIPEYLDTIAATQPKVIYLSYGVNDMGLDIGREEGDNGYQTVYERNIKALLERSPNSKIVVNSIIDPTPAAIAQAPRWDKVDDFNRQIKEMCERNGWTYVDNSSLAENGNAPIYAPDGIHFLSTFYETWAKNMLKAQYAGLSAV